ncbi:MAG: DarT ssDNA thymidine ADP-ribosyltransferase family protein [Bacillota bacterium]|nr:DarT ssDNA thymidine ADP-ribosyltransferase family protein [Bacillota bacterium]
MARFYPDNRLDQIDEVDWEAVATTDFRNPEVKEGKQAEFLVYEFFPWHLIQRIGVQCSSTHNRVIRALRECADKPAVEILPNWYY